MDAGQAHLAKMWRFILAGPLVLLATLLVMAGSSLWLPEGEAGVDHFVLPVVLLPALWAVLFFYSVLDRLGRASAVVLVLSLSHAGLIAWHLISGQ